MITLKDDTTLVDYGRINVILGKNGSGKSTLLRSMDTELSRNNSCIRYVTPERGGELTYEGNIETNRSHDPAWIGNSRRKNQWSQFKNASMTEYRSLETLALRIIEKDCGVRKSDFTFDSEINEINNILDRVELERSDSSDFGILTKEGNQSVNPSQLSSGESELITLAIEILYFSYLCKLDKYKEKDNWLLLDEPDVHLHPDLQHRLMELLVQRMGKIDGRVAIGTHSTTILSSLRQLEDDVRMGIMHIGEKELKFRPVDEAAKAILPVFGAHPLSNIFNERPPLIVEGEDDERIWQAAVRHSQGRVSVYPCVAGDIQSMRRYEATADELMNAVYENAKAFSLRDRDEDPYKIEDQGLVVRCRLFCRNAENLIVTDDVLEELDTTWEKLEADLDKWIGDNPQHPRYSDAIDFRDSGWDRREFDLKSMRSVIVGITGSTKPWEVAVGRAIARLPENRFKSEHSLAKYLGEKLIKELDLECNSGSDRE